MKNTKDLKIENLSLGLFETFNTYFREKGPVAEKDPSKNLTF